MKDTDKSPKKPNIALIVILAVIVIIAIVLLVIKVSVTPDGHLTYSSSAVQTLSDRDASKSDIYAVLDHFDNSPLGGKDDILALCEHCRTTYIGGKQVDHYFSDELSNYLYFPQFTEMSVSGDLLYISYYTSQHEPCEVNLVYDDDGLISMSVYNVKTDTLVLKENGTATLQTNFRHGNSVIRMPLLIWIFDRLL